MNSLLYIANVRLPTEKAHGIQIVKTCEALASSGIKVVLLVPNRKNFLKDDIFDFYKLSKNFTIQKVPCIDLMSIPFLKKFTFWLESFTFYLSVNKYIAKNKFYAYYTRDFLLAFFLSKKLSNFFYEVHSLPAKLSKKYTEVWKRVKGIVVISNGIKNDLVSFGVPERKIIIARDAVDLDKFKINETQLESRDKLKVDDHEKIVLYAGHLYEWKGADVVAQAAKYLTEVQIYLVGGTEEDVKKFKNKYSFKNLHIVGHVSHDTIPRWLNAADILVLPNSAKEKISSHYTSPMKLFEYMTAKRPILASDLPSLKEILDTDTAVFFRADSVVSFVAEIKKMLIDCKMPQIADNANKKVQEFSWNKRAKQIMNFIFVIVCCASDPKPKDV